ncbi:MAG: prepilin-type N-terminal cleavage/methylation domain-containing protein [Candidatus Aureabacteria bacterium]|nr:prepilin-type N-terminal cleavage/methylation domain-containing protein [Candidatus Auribacterota bacterium]
MKNIFKRKKKPEGFTLVEVVASLLILSIGVLGIMSLFPVGIRAVTNANDTASATMLAQLKISQLLYGRPDSLLGSGGSPGPLICWDGNSFNYIVWDSAGWTYDSSSGPYPFKDNAKFFWAACRRDAHDSFDMSYYDAIDDLYRIDLFVFRKERLPSAFSLTMPAFTKFSFLVKLP